MSKSVKIYGASDDLVEVEGDVPGCNEYNVWDKAVFVEFNTGDVFRVEYTNSGVWVVDHHVKSGERLVVRKVPHADGDDPDPYTDTVEVLGPIKWVDVWEDWPPTVTEKREKIEEAVELGLDEKLVGKVYELIRRK